MPRKSKQHFQPRFETLEPRHMLSLSTALQFSSPGVSTTPIGRSPLSGFVGTHIPIRDLTPILPAIPSPPVPVPPPAESPAPPTSSIPEIPQLQKSVNLAITGDGFFIVQNRQGHQRFTRDGRFRLNNDRQLVTQRGDQVMGYLTENGSLAKDLVPLRIPANDEEVFRETKNIFFRGNLAPTGTVASVPGLIESQILVTDEFEIPDDSQFTTANFQVELQPAADVQGSVGLAPYSYYVTFSSSAGVLGESRPTHSVGPLAVTQPGRRIRIDGIPQPTVDYDRINIYRNTAADPSSFYRVAQIPAGQSVYLDHLPDAAILGNPELDIDGTRINQATRLFNVQTRNGANFTNLFGPGPGTISFTPRKGDRILETKTLAVNATTTVQDLLNFIEEASGIEGSLSTARLSEVVDGRIRITSNAGIGNFVQIGLASTTFTPAGTNVVARSVPLAFAALQTPEGEGTTTEFEVVDSLGTPLTVRVTTALVQKTGTSTVYRWYATSPDNQPSAGVSTTIGTGLLTYNGNGKLVSDGSQTLVIQRSSAETPLEIEIDFSRVSGLHAPVNHSNSRSNLHIFNQDGFPPGTLKDYAITGAGKIKGVFTSGLQGELGQIPLATIPNPFALRQVAYRLYAQTTASGVPKVSNATAEPQASFNWLPPDYFVAQDGAITKDRTYRPTASSLAAASPTSPRYPWIVRSAHLKIDGRGFFAIEGRDGKTQFTRDGNFRLNRDQELVTQEGLRVLGYGVDENSAIDPSQLKPLSVPLGSFGHQATTTADFSGFLSPPVEIAAQPAVFESVLFYNDLTVDTKFMEVFAQSGTGVQVVNVQGSLPSNPLSPEGMQITPDTTIGQWMAFLEDALGIDKTMPGQQDAGVKIVDGRIWITSYNSAMRIFLGNKVFSWNFKPPGSDVKHFAALLVSTPFQQVQYHQPKKTLIGKEARTNFIAYDHLGQEVAVRLRTFFESQDANSATYRWTATIPGNLPNDGKSTVVGSGQLVFSTEGELLQGALGEIVIEQPSNSSPLTIQLDFSQISGLASLDHLGRPSSYLNFLRQDGFPPGRLKKFEIASNGELRGTFSNGMVRPLGQVLLTKFPRPWALRYSGHRVLNSTLRAGRPRFVEPGRADTGELLSRSVASHSRHRHGQRISPHPTRTKRLRKVVDTVSTVESWHLPKLFRKLAARTLQRHQRH